MKYKIITVKILWVMYALPTSIFAEEVVSRDENIAVLPTINLTAYETFKNDKLTKYATIGSLGQQAVVDTPFTVTSYANQGIRNQQASTLGDVLKNDPSIRTSTGSHHFNENFLLRGFPLNYEDISYNNFYGMAPFGHTPTEFLESVTVLKGPNALIGGVAPSGGAVGGVIIANPKRADQDITRLSTSFQDDSYFQNHVDVSRRFGSEKQFGIRTNLVYGDGEHYIEGMNDRKALGSLAADYTTDNFNVRLDAYSIREERKGGTPTIVRMTDTTGVVDAPNGDLNYFNGLTGESRSQFAGLSSEYHINPNIKVYGNIGYAEKEAQGFLNGTRLMLMNSQGAAAGQLYNLNYAEHNVSGRLGIETQFHTGIVEHTLGLRGDYMTRKTLEHSLPSMTPAFTTDLYNPSNSPVMPATPALKKSLDNRYTSYVLTDNMAMLDERLQLTLGLRYQEMKLQNHLTANSESKDYDKFSPSVGVLVKPFGENLSLYANYMEGLSDGISVTFPRDANYRKVFDPQTSKQYEIGAKFVQGSWYNTLAMFQIDRPGTQVTRITPQDAQSPTQITTDGVETRSKGIEWTTSGNITEDLSLYGQVSYNDTEIKKAYNNLNVGKSIPGVPEFTAAMELQYRIPQTDSLYVTARGTYVGEQELSANNSLQLPDYSLLDLGLRYSAKVGGVDTTILATVNNVTDEKYWEGVFGGADWATIGAGRSYKVGLTFNF